MWTATIKEKGITIQGAYVDVDFTDGVTINTERCFPQNIDAFKLWVKSRLATFNVKDAIDAQYTVDGPAVIEETPITLPPEEIAWNAWYADFLKMKQVQILIDMDVFVGDETAIVTLRNRLKNNFLVSYIDRF